MTTCEFGLFPFPIIIFLFVVQILTLKVSFKPFLLFPWRINCSHAFRCTKFSTHSSPSWFLSKEISFPKIHVVTDDHELQASSCTSEWKIASTFILRFDTHLTPSWRRFQTMRSAPSSQSWTPSNLVLLHFFEFLYLGDFVIGWPCFWWWSWNCLQRFVWN
jgi:hypothetical protein